MRFWPEVTPLFISRIMNVSFLFENWWKMYKIVAAFRGMHVSPAKHSFGKCDRRTDGQSDPYVSLCFTDDTTKMRCIRQVNKNYIPFLHYFIEITIFAFWCLPEGKKKHNINGNERSNKTTLNINIFLMECTRMIKFRMMTHHYLSNSLGNSMMPYDLDCNFQGHWYRVYCI